jgi:hypothetical protein
VRVARVAPTVFAECRIRVRAAASRGEPRHARAVRGKRRVPDSECEVGLDVVGAAAGRPESSTRHVLIAKAVPTDHNYRHERPEESHFESALSRIRRLLSTCGGRTIRPVLRPKEVKREEPGTPLHRLVPTRCPMAKSRSSAAWSSRCSRSASSSPARPSTTSTRRRGASTWSAALGTGSRTMTSVARSLGASGSVRQAGSLDSNGR